MKTIIQCLYGTYLAWALVAFAGINLREWQFYAILIPVVALVEWKGWVSL